MSAIFGVLNFGGAPVASRVLERMASALAHRGPDGSDLWIDGRIGLGHSLMRVTQEDAFDAQPLHDLESGIALVADLRLDNRAELARSLDIGGARLRGLPDSALLLHAYQKWGDSCVEHLLGDYVFAIWSARERRLLLGRDHLSQRACFFHCSERALVFASEIKGLWAHPDVPRLLSDVAIARTLMRDRSLRPGATPYEGIEGVPGAQILSIAANGAVSRRSYWQPHPDPAHEGHGEGYYVEAYRAVLGEAVACRVRRTTAPAGLLLSGGYDSAAVAALAGPTVAAQGRKLIAACSAMPADYSGSIRHARKWVEMCRRDMPHLDVHYVTRDGMNLLAELEQSFRASDVASGPYSAVDRRLYAALRNAGARVVMDGYGGDQTLNPRGQTQLAQFLASGRLQRFLQELRGHRRMTGAPLTRIVRDELLATLLPISLVRLWRSARRGFAPVWLDRPVGKEFARQMIDQGHVTVGDLRASGRKGTDVQAHMLRALQRRVASARSNSLAFAHGVEPTQPFYDKRVVELALAVPLDLHVRNGRNRYLACRALVDLYPPEFQTRWRMNDDQIPDFQHLIKSGESQILTEIARMEKSEALSRYVDFGKIRHLLAARGPDDHNSGWEQETQVAISTLASARFIEWFRGYN